MELIKLLNPLLLVIGIFYLSLSLHLKEEGKNSSYGFPHGWANNLTRKGRLYFFISIIITLVSVSLFNHF